MQQLSGRKLIFVSGKGGVGKTAVSQAIALALSRKPGIRVLWATFEDPTRPAGELEMRSPSLAHLNADAGLAFEQYVALKIRVPLLTQVFLRNRVINYLSKAAPGIHELVLLGKIWHERINYDHVVVDMPSTGYGVAMFQSTSNFSRLFKGGPIQRDALEMLETFGDPSACLQLIVSLPEETPLRESLELRDLLSSLFPLNPPRFLLNKLLPSDPGDFDALGPPDQWANPFASSVTEYARKRAAVERENLRIWSESGVSFSVLPHVPWPVEGTAALVQDLSERLGL